VRRFALIARGRGDRIHWFESMAYADRFNARTVARLHRLGLRALLRRMQRTRADLVRRFRRLPAASLRDPRARVSGDGVAARAGLEPRVRDSRRRDQGLVTRQRTANRRARSTRDGRR